MEIIEQKGESVMDVTKEETAEETTVEDTVEKTSTPIYIVNAREGLNLREKPDLDSRILGVIDYGTKVRVNDSPKHVGMGSASESDFYSITTSCGASGYCMKKFITPKYSE